MGSLSHRNNRLTRLVTETDALEEYKALDVRRASVKDLAAKNDSQVMFTESGDMDDHRAPCTFSRSVSERTPFRRSRSERKQAWLDSASSICKDED